MSDAEVQAVFDKVIDAGIYPKAWFMCEALARAVDIGVLDALEADLAYLAIQEYIGEHITVREALFQRGHTAFEWNTFDWAHSEGVHFYRNWADRPEVRDADS